MVKFTPAEIRKLRRQLKANRTRIDPKDIQKLLRAGTRIPTFQS